MPFFGSGYSESPIMALSFENFRGLKNFTPEEIVRLREHCFAKKVEVEGHYLYMGKDENNYSQTSITFRGRKYHFNRHQLSLFLKKYDCPDFDMATGWDNATTSHLCTKKRCVRPEHLELESSDLNNSRILCFQAGRCFHHGDAPDCII